MFHGLLVRVSVRVHPPTRILIVPADGTTAPPPSRFTRLHLGEARFYVLTAPLDADAADRARDYLMPALRDAPLAIDDEEVRGGQGRASLRAAFNGDSFYLALPRADGLGIGLLRIGRVRPFLDPGGVLFLGDLEETVRTMAHDAATTCRILDCLAGR